MEVGHQTTTNDDSGTNRWQQQQPQTNSDLSTTMEEDESREEDSSGGHSEIAAATPGKRPATGRPLVGMQRQASMPYGMLSPGRGQASYGLPHRRKISTARTCRPIHYEESRAKELAAAPDGEASVSVFEPRSNAKEFTPRRRSASLGERGDVSDASDEDCDGTKKYACTLHRRSVHHDNFAHKYSERLYPDVMLSGTFGKIQRRNLAAALLNFMPQNKGEDGDGDSSYSQASILQMPQNYRKQHAGLTSRNIPSSRLFSRSNSCPQPKLLFTRPSQRRPSRMLRSTHEGNEEDYQDDDFSNSDNEGDSAGTFVDNDDEDDGFCCRSLSSHKWLHTQKLHRLLLRLERVLHRHFGVYMQNTVDDWISLFWSRSLNSFRKTAAGILLAVALVVIIFSFFISSSA